MVGGFIATHSYLRSTATDTAAFIAFYKDPITVINKIQIIGYITS